MATRSLYQHLADDSVVGRYAPQAQRLLRYQRYLESALPPALRSHVRVANWRSEKLVIYARNAAIAAKVRQLAPRLAGIFASEGVKVNEIDVRTQPGASSAPEGNSQKIKSLPGSPQRLALQTLADGLAEDSPLRAALLRLTRSISGR